MNPDLAAILFLVGLAIGLITLFSILVIKGNKNKGGGSINTATFYGAADGFMNQAQKKAAKTIVLKDANEKEEEQNSGENIEKNLGQNAE